MRRWRALAIVFLAFLLTPPMRSRADDVTLKDGTVLRGKIVDRAPVGRGGYKITLQTDGKGSTREISGRDIQEIKECPPPWEARHRNLKDYEREAENLKEDDWKEQMKLAKYCRRLRLKEQARLHLLKAYELKAKEATGNCDKLVRLAEWCTREGLPERARKCYDDAFEAKKASMPEKTAKAYLALGKWAESCDRIQTARENYNLALGVDPACKAARDALLRMDSVLLKRAVKFVRESCSQLKETGGWADRWGAGLLFLCLGKSDRDLRACLEFFKENYEGRGGNRNWHMGLSFHFFSEYYLRYRSPEVKKLLEKCVVTAKEAQEETGGWCHYKGFWKGGYHQVGGGKDIAALTGLIFSALWNMKAAGLKVPEDLLGRTESNLQSLSDKRGSFTYGTANPSNWDGAGTRGAIAILGLLNAGEREHSFVPPAIEAAEKRGIPNVEGGHGFAALHFYAVARVLYHAGAYDRFASAWLGKLMDKQAENGSVHLIHDNGKHGRLKFPAAETGIFAILLMLQYPDAFRAAGSEAGGWSRRGRKRKRSQKEE